MEFDISASLACYQKVLPEKFETPCFLTILGWVGFGGWVAGVGNIRITSHFCRFHLNEDTTSVRDTFLAGMRSSRSDGVTQFIALHCIAL